MGKYYAPPPELGDAGSAAAAGAVRQAPGVEPDGAALDVESAVAAIAQIDTFDDDELRKLNRLRSLCNFMDAKYKVPILGYRFGADAVIGMVPYAGDAFGALIGLYIVSRAIRYQLPKRLVAHMAVNQAIDACCGVIPFFGDLFDATYKANYRNMQLLEDHLKQPAKAKRADTCFLLGLFFMARPHAVVVLPFIAVAAIIAGIIVGILALTGKL